MAQASAAEYPHRSKPARHRPSWARVLLVMLLILVWIIALALVSSVVFYQQAYQGRIHQGVLVRGIDLGGMTVAEAEARLQVAFDPYPLAPVTIRYGDLRWILTAEDLGVDFDARSAAQAAYRVGRQPVSGSTIWQQVGQLQSNVQEQLQAYQQGHEVLALETVDQSAGLLWLEDIAQDINQPVVEASLRVDGLEVSTSPSQVGYSLDVAASHQAIYETLLANEGGTVDLVIRETKPLLSDVTQAEVFARQVLAGPITLTASDPDLDAQAPPPDFSIPAEDLAPLLDLEVMTVADGSRELKASLNVEPLRDRVRSWAAELAREPRDARLEYDPDNGEISVVTPSQIGRMLDVDATLVAIHQAALSQERQATLPLHLVEPAVNMHRIDEMASMELISEGSTNFAGSSADRVHNIKTAAAAADNVVVPPGQVFSFNEAIGDVDEEHGYKDSLIIWGDRTAVGIGGGVCQVSTTAFRAAYYAGLPIEERWNHGYVVGWYGEPGLDATIYTPTVDFKFGNTTDGYLIVKSEVDEARGILTFRLYGTKPDWQVEVTGPEILAEEPPASPVYQEDPSLARGEVKQVEWSKKGLDVQWRRVVTDGEGQVVSDETLYSSYTPWPSYYLVGPGTAIPDGVEFRSAVSQPSGG